MLSASADTGTLPKSLSAEIDKVPPSISTPPSKELFELERVRVPAWTITPLLPLVFPNWLIVPVNSCEPAPDLINVTFP